MSRKGISKLALPKRKYDPAHSTERRDGRIRLETLQEAREEDLRRAQSAKAHASERFSEWAYEPLEGHPGLHDPLSRRLLRADDGDAHATPASKIWMRDRRRAVAGDLWRLHDELALDERFFVLMPRCWEVPSDELLTFDPARIIKPFRTMLQHYGSGRTDGYLFAGIDGEYSHAKKVFRLHLQGIAAGGMIEIVERLRQTRNFKPVGVGKPGKRRTVLRMQKVNSRPDPYTYVMKSTWFVNSYQCPDTEEEVRLRNPRRIPDPHHARYLQWLDRWRLEDLTVMVALRVGKEGLVYRPGKSNRIE